MSKKVKFGVIADTHPDIVPGGEEKMAAFLDACRKENVDFIIELGDFSCKPSKPDGPKIYYDKDKILALFKNFEKPSYHVIGNHDCDGNTKKEDLLAHYGVSYGPYYSFDMGGFHFVVLDNCNYWQDGKVYSHDCGYMQNAQGGKKIFPYIPQEQLIWLEEDLAKAKNPAIVFAHYPILAPSTHGIHEARQKNNADLERILANAPSGTYMCINGHTHLDQLYRTNAIWQYTINSMSNWWAGSKFTCLNRFTPDIDEKFPLLRYVTPYKDAVYAIIEMDENGAMVKGAKSEFVGKTPEELGVYTNKEVGWTYAEISMLVTPRILDRYIPFIK